MCMYSVCVVSTTESPINMPMESTTQMPFNKGKLYWIYYKYSALITFKTNISTKYVNFWGTDN